MFNKSEIENLIKDFLEKTNTPSSAISIVIDNKIVLKEAYGYRDVENKVEADINTIYAIGSLSKSFGTAAIGKLVDEGKLSLDDLVIDHIPEFKLYDDYATRNATIRDILSHKTGLPRHDIMWLANNYDIDVMLEKLKYLKPFTSFRGKYNYQNHMFMIANYLIGKLAGKDTEEYIRETLFSALDMNNSNFSVIETQKIDNHALPYQKIVESVQKVPFRDIRKVGIAGSINSNIVDMTNYLLFQMNKGEYNGKQVVSNESITETHTPHTIAPSMILGEENGYYGLGLGIKNYRGTKLIHHSGGIDGFNSYLCFIPEKKTGIVILANSGNCLMTFNTPLANTILDKIIFDVQDTNWSKVFEPITKTLDPSEAIKDFLSKKVEGTSPSKELKNYQGTYIDKGYGEISIKCRNNKLYVKYGVLPEQELQHVHYDTFILAGSLPTTVTFSKGIFGDFDSINIPFEEMLPEGIVFKKVK